MRSLFRLLALAGGLGIGLFLFRAAPRDVTLVYDLAAAPGATALEVDLLRGTDLVRHAELRVTPGIPLRHPVRLTDGEYRLHFRIATPGQRSVEGERPLVVREGGTIVLPLGP